MLESTTHLLIYDSYLQRFLKVAKDRDLDTNPSGGSWITIVNIAALVHSSSRF